MSSAFTRRKQGRQCAARSRRPRPILLLRCRHRRPFTHRPLPLHHRRMSRSHEQRLNQLATSFGLGLQLTNIIKDVADDARRVGVLSRVTFAQSTTPARGITRTKQAGRGQSSDGTTYCQGPAEPGRRPTVLPDAAAQRLPHSPVLPDTDVFCPAHLTPRAP